MEVIDYDQTTFLPLRFIFKNIMLVQELINWAKRTKSTTCFFKIGLCTSLWQDELGVFVKGNGKDGCAQEIFVERS
jgi:hypothetical protein